MATLTGSTIASSYEQLLSLPDGGGNGATLVAITDGDAGTTFALQVSTIGIAVDSNFTGTTSATTKAAHIDFDATGITASGQTATNIGLDLDMNSNSPTMVGTVVNTGIDLDLTAGTSGTQTNVGVNIAVAGADTNYALITSGGNVGIGTASPSAHLEIVGNTDYAQIKLTDTDSDDTIQRTGILSQHYKIGEEDVRVIGMYTSDATSNIQIGGGSSDHNSAQLIQFFTSSNYNTVTGTIRMVIDESGVVNFKAVDGGAESTTLSTNASGHTLFGNDTANKDMNYTVSGSGSHYFSTAVANMVTFNNAGFVGIGGTSPGMKLQLQESTHGANVGLRLYGENDAGTGQDAHIILDPDAVFFGLSKGGSTIDLGVNLQGNVGIGETTPQGHLGVRNVAIDTDVGYIGFNNSHAITDGASNGSDNSYGAYNYMAFNDAGSFFGELNGGTFQAVSGQTSGGEGVMVKGAHIHAEMAGNTDVNSVYGGFVLADVDAGEVDSNITGLYVSVDLESGVGGTFGNYGVQTSIDADTDMASYGYYYEGYSNQDLHWQSYSHTVGSIVSRIWDSGQIDAEGTINASQSLDYAEYFESKDGNVIASGTTVKLDGDKIVACESGDTPIGVIRPKSSETILGGAQLFHWKDKHEKDAYGGIVMEDFTKTKWLVEIDEAEYLKRRDQKEQKWYSKVEGSEAVPAKDAVEAVEAQDAVYETVTKQRQKVVVSEVEEEVSSTEIVLEDGKYVQKTTTETITKEVETPQYEEVTLYDEDGEEIGTHQVQIMEDYEEEQLVSEAVIEVVGIAAVEAVDAVPNTYFREHKYYSDRIPDGLTVPDDAEIINISDKRPKLNSSYDASKEESYKSREERDEWHIVGLLGQIPITKGQPMADNWIKMSDVSDTVEMYFVK